VGEVLLSLIRGNFVRYGEEEDCGGRVSQDRVRRQDCRIMEKVWGERGT